MQNATPCKGGSFNCNPSFLMYVIWSGNGPSRIRSLEEMRMDGIWSRRLLWPLWPLWAILAVLASGTGRTGGASWPYWAFTGCNEKYEQESGERKAH